MGMQTRRYRLALIPIAITVLCWIFPIVNSMADTPQKSQSGSKIPLMKMPATDTTNTKDTDQSRPQLVYPTDTHDFGSVTRGSRLIHVFTVQNTGNAPLKIFKAKGT